MSASRSRTRTAPRGRFRMRCGSRPARARFAPSARTPARRSGRRSRPHFTGTPSWSRAFAASRSIASVGGPVSASPVRSTLSTRSTRLSETSIPTAERTPEAGGTSTRFMPSSSATAAPCIGPAPPKAIRVSSRGSMPRSTVITRTAPAISALATRRIPRAVSRRSRPNSSARRAHRGRGVVEADPIGQRRGWVEIAEHQVGVGDRRLIPAVPVTGRPRVGARGLRPHAQRAACVAPRDAAAAGANGVHVHHRDGQRAAGDLAAAALAHPPSAHDAHVGGGSAHVEADRLGRAGGGRGRRPRRPPARRARSRIRASPRQQPEPRRRPTA